MVATPLAPPAPVITLPTQPPAPTAPTAPTQDGQGEGENKAKAKRTLNGVYVQTPPVLRQRLEEVAKAESKTPAAYVRDLLAQMWGIQLPPARSRQRYASPDEKKEVQRAKRIERQQLIKQLLAEHQAKMAAQANGAVAGAAGAAATNGVAS